MGYATVYGIITFNYQDPRCESITLIELFSRGAQR